MPIYLAGIGRTVGFEMTESAGAQVAGEPQDESNKLRGSAKAHMNEILFTLYKEGNLPSPRYDIGPSLPLAHILFK